MVWLVWYGVVLFSMVDTYALYGILHYGGEAQGGSKFHLITTQAPAQPI